MADIIKCPTCGAKNPADQEFCQFCQSRLQPLTGPLKGLDKTIKPGDIPTKKDTGQLETILPEWLRDARSSAKKSSEDDVKQGLQQPQESRPPVSSGADLLAGLQATRQAGDDDEEDMPDWLTSITGAAPKSKKSQPDSSDVRRVELGAKDDFAHDEAAADTPAWLTGLAPSAPQSNEKDELTDWFQNATNIPQTQPPVVQPFAFDDNSIPTPIADETPEWLKGIAAEKAPNKDIKLQPDSGNIFNPPSDSSETPDWLHSMPAASEVPGVDPVSFSEAGFGQSDSAADASAADVPDWLKGFEAATPADASSATASDQAWLKDLQTTGPSQPTTQSETPAWLKSDTSAEETEAPPWLSADAAAPKAAIPEQKPNPAPIQEDELSLGDVPSWLKAAAPQSSIFGEPPVEQKVPAPLPPSSDTPDWLNAFKSDDAPGSQAVPAFVDAPETSGSSEALFTDMPDWLASANDSRSSPLSPPPTTNADALSQSELPSWVQAMRPVDSGISQTSASRSYSSDRTLESRGALAGLQGVLPAVPGFMATSKPKAYSIKLQASEEQQVHADLLEQILAAETEPVPLTSFSVLATSRILRRILALVVVSSLVAVLLLHTQIFSMPVGKPFEIDGALRVAQSIPDSAPVLVVSDYEPSRVGEMEAAAAPMFDQMLLLHHPRLTFISTNNTGSILTEHFISGPLAGYNLHSGVEYVNLGYLPGGQMGIRAFAQNPLATSPFTFAQSSSLVLTPAWILPPLAGVTSLSQFSAFIMVTDNADSARAWIEQTAAIPQGTIPFVVISSAQAAPMIEPYYASKQVAGLVSGLYGAAVFEQNNAGRPGTARIYWDAYSIGMLLAMALILVGGLWNLALGLQDRAAARETR